MGELRETVCCINPKNYKSFKKTLIRAEWGSSVYYAKIFII